MQFVGYEALAVTSASAVGFANIPKSNPNARALIRCETGAMRVRGDGVAPTTTVGFPLATTDLPIAVSNLSALQFIAQSTSGVVHAMYYVN